MPQLVRGQSAVLGGRPSVRVRPPSPWPSCFLVHKGFLGELDSLVSGREEKLQATRLKAHSTAFGTLVRAPLIARSPLPGLGGVGLGSVGAAPPRWPRSPFELHCTSPGEHPSTNQNTLGNNAGTIPNALLEPPPTVRTNTHTHPSNKHKHQQLPWQPQRNSGTKNQHLGFRDILRELSRRAGH